MTGPDRLPLSLVPQEPDQVPRLSQFRRAHPGITIGAGHGYWQAQIPLLSGEQVITRYQLRDLLDKLYAGRSIGEIARHISDPGDPCPALVALQTPASVPLSRRPVRAAATVAPAVGAAVQARITPAPREDVMMLTPAQLAAITELANEWSVLWDKHRRLWIAAQDSPDGEQFDEADLDTLLTLIGQLPG